MGKTKAILFPQQIKLLSVVGEQMKMARLKRAMTITEMSMRSGLSRITISKIEAGDPTVSMGAYLKVLSKLGLEESILKIAEEDELGDRILLSKLKARGKSI